MPPGGGRAAGLAQENPHRAGLGFAPVLVLGGALDVQILAVAPHHSQAHVLDRVEVLGGLAVDRMGEAARRGVLADHLPPAAQETRAIAGVDVHRVAPLRDHQPRRAEGKLLVADEAQVGVLEAQRQPGLAS